MNSLQKLHKKKKENNRDKNESPEVKYHKWEEKNTRDSSSKMDFHVDVEWCIRTFMPYA